MNRVCQILKIQKPVIQAPMSWITNAALVSAVSNAGGLGVLGPNAGFPKPVSSVKETVESMRKTIRETKRLTNKPFGINISPSVMDPQGYGKALVDLCKEEGVNVIVIAGVCAPDDYRKLKERGFTVIAREMNPTVRGAKKIEESGADIIVATGCDEGGCMPVLHNGTFSATALLSDAVKIPVLAAGGIVNEKMAKAARDVGAEGVFAGTRFILSKECPSSKATKEDIMNTHADDFLVFTHMNGTSRWRTTPHKTGREGIELNKKGDLNAPCGDFRGSMLLGKVETGVNSVSNLAPLIKSIDSCKDIVNELARPFNC